MEGSQAKALMHHLLYDAELAQAVKMPVFSFCKKQTL